jgi:hypothetical protein
VIGFGEPSIRSSAAGCSNEAAFRVNWRNPRIHTPDRVKVWLACPDHRDTLADYLRTRSFPVQVTTLEVELDRVPDPT